MKLLAIKLVVAFASLKFFVRSSDTLLLYHEENFSSRAITSLVTSQKHLKTSVINVVSEDWDRDDLDDVLMNLSFDFSVQIESFDEALKAHSQRFFVIVFVRNVQRFVKFSKDMNQEAFRFNGFLVIVLEDRLRVEMEYIFELFWKKFIFNVNVLVEAQSSSKVSLFTFLPFNEKSCADVTRIKINEFDNESMSWETEDFFPRKFSNLQKCLIKTGSFVVVPAVMNCSSSSHEKYCGNAIDFMNGFASALNFTNELTVYSDSVIGHFYKNKTANGLMNRPYTGEVDVIIGVLSLQESRTEFLSASRAFYFDRIILVIPPDIPIDPMKKLLLPFDTFTWIGLLLILFIATALLLALKILPREFHNFILGKFIKNQLLNIWSVFLGGSQTRLPGTNFARFMLMSFAMFCLVMRNSYTGSLFHILKNDINSKEIRNIDELIKLDFKFYIYESLAPRLKDDELIKR